MVGVPFDDAAYFAERDRSKDVVSLNTQTGTEPDDIYNPYEEASLLALGIDLNSIRTTPPRTSAGAPIPTTGISGLSARVDAYLSEEHESKLDKTKSPVESGGQSVTHTVREPAKVRLVGRIVGPGSQSAWQEIRAIQSSMRLVTAYTSLGAYRNMLIVGAQAFIDDKSGYNLPFELELEELIVYTGGGSGAEDETEDRGKSSTKTVIGPVTAQNPEGIYIIGTSDEARAARVRGGGLAIDRDVGLVSGGERFYGNKTFEAFTQDQYDQLWEDRLNDPSLDFSTPFSNVQVSPGTLGEYRHADWVDWRTDPNGGYVAVLKEEAEKRLNDELNGDIEEREISGIRSGFDVRARP